MDNNYNYRQPWIMQRADPYVYHKDGFYYLRAACPNMTVLPCAEVRG